MKKTIYSTVLLSSLLLAGCQDSTATPASDESDTGADSTEQVADTETAEDENSDDTTKEEEADAEIEEVTYQYQVNRDTFAIEPIDPEENSDEKLVLLTFDDAPYGNTMEIAKALEERDVSAIFFVNGMYMEEEEGFETMQEIHDMGFEIGNHTYTHATLNDGMYSQEDIHSEIFKTGDIVEEAIGERPRFFRAPHGIMTDYAEQVVAEDGMSWMNWSFGYDWEVQYQDAQALADITLNTPLLGDGTNILMHDREWTASAVPAIVDGLLEQGFTIVDPKLITHEE